MENRWHIIVSTGDVNEEVHVSGGAPCRSLWPPRIDVLYLTFDHSIINGFTSRDFRCLYRWNCVNYAARRILTNANCLRSRWSFNEPSMSKTFIPFDRNITTAKANPLRRDEGKSKNNVFAEDNGQQPNSRSICPPPAHRSRDQRSRGTQSYSTSPSYLATSLRELSLCFGEGWDICEGLLTGQILKSPHIITTIALQFSELYIAQYFNAFQPHLRSCFFHHRFSKPSPSISDWRFLNKGRAPFSNKNGLPRYFNGW